MKKIARYSSHVLASLTVVIGIRIVCSTNVVAEGITLAESIPGTVLVVEPITADNPLYSKFKSAKNNQNFSLGYWPDNSIKILQIKGKSNRECCENYLNKLMDKYANPVGYKLIQERDNGSIKYQVYIAPFIQVFLWLRVDSNVQASEKIEEPEVPVGFFIAQ